MHGWIRSMLNSPLLIWPPFDPDPYAKVKAGLDDEGEKKIVHRNTESYTIAIAAAIFNVEKDFGKKRKEKINDL